jgi:hypothetical protein
VININQYLSKNSSLEEDLTKIALKISQELNSLGNDYFALFEEEPAGKKDSIFKFTSDILGDEEAIIYKYEEIFSLVDGFINNIIKDMGVNLEDPESLLENPKQVLNKMYLFFTSMEKIRKKKNNYVNNLVRNFDKENRKKFLLRWYGSKAVDKGMLKSLLRKEEEIIGLTEEWENKHIKYKERLIGKLHKSGKKFEIEGPVVTYEKFLKKIKNETEADISGYIR